MPEPEYLYLQRVAGLGVCPKCRALPNEPCTGRRQVGVKDGYAIWEEKPVSWPHSGRVSIGNRRA